MRIIRWIRYALGQSPDIEIIRDVEVDNKGEGSWRVFVDGEQVFSVEVLFDGSFIVSTSQMIKNGKGGLPC